VKRISKDAGRLIESATCRISPIVVLELETLYEIKRSDGPAQAVILQLRSVIELEICGLPFGRVTEMACYEAWTRDPFDRMIVAQARAGGNAPLITADEHILKNYSRAVW